MTIVQRLNGDVYVLETLGIRTIDFIVSSPSPRNITEEVESQNGLVDLGTTIDARKIQVIFRLEAFDTQDYVLLRNEIFRVFDSRERFFLIDSREPGKRWNVKCANSFDISQKFIYGDFAVEFICFNGFAESIGTTVDPLTFDSQIWQTGQGLTLDETMYTHSSNTFKIYNAADGVTIDPRQIPLVITFKGASNNLTITNTTTGDVWQYKKATVASDTLVLDGVRSLKNGSSVFADTNHRIITLAPGYNDFVVSGTSGAFSIGFAFRFYTL